MRNTRRKPRARRETPACMRPRGRVARAPRGRVASVAQDARKKRRKPHARAFARGCAGACAKPHGTRPYTPSRSASRTHAALRRASVRARVPWRAMGRRRNREGTRRLCAATRRDMRAQDARAHAREKPSRKTRSALRARPSHDSLQPSREAFPRCRNTRGKTSCETSQAAPQTPFQRDDGTPPRGKRRRARKHRARPSPTALCDRRGRPSRDGKKPSREARGRACKRALPMRSRATAERHLAQTRALARSARTSRLHATGAPQSVL